MSPLDIEKLKSLHNQSDRYLRRLKALDQKGLNTTHIKKTVDEAAANVSDKVESFVIYGEPQSGKTEMMIALTAKLLDEGHQIIIELLNDNVQLLQQNLTRFLGSGIDPSPTIATDILGETIGDKKWVIFCKKNINDLKKLISKVSGKSVVIIDDEADYASPNSKINKDEITAINSAIKTLMGKGGVYIGVTATPARLDLNNTFENISEKWVDFETHEHYVGKDTFFPLDLSGTHQYQLHTLPDQGDDPKHLRRALLSFLVNVAFINTDSQALASVTPKASSGPVNFCFLIHTSGKVDDHEYDYTQVNKIFDVLSDVHNSKYEQYLTEAYQIAADKYGELIADDILSFIVGNITKKKILVMNNKKKHAVNPTTPPALFSVVIGGNIISRGVTLDNLLGMFFTRDVKHRMQQDTYIQRARMFGNRKKYLKYFELWIPESLYDDWHRCFVYHHLSLQAIKSSGGAPVWVSDKRISPASPSSVDEKYVVMDQGEMSFAKFQYISSDELLESKLSPIEKLEKLRHQFGEQALPKYLIDFIKLNSTSGARVAFLKSRLISPEAQGHKELYRKKGFISSTEMNAYPNAVHFIKIIHNKKDEARLLYKSARAARFIKNTKTGK